MEDHTVESRSLVLPPELLGSIFSGVSKESPLELGSSLFVCRTWHAIIVEDPALWTAITLNSQIYTRIAAYKTRGSSQDNSLDAALSFYEMCLQRSKSAPLRFNIDLEGFAYLGPTSISTAGLRQLLTVFVGRSREHAPRWTEFMWKHNSEILHTQDLLKCLPQELMSLQRLTLSLFDFYIPINPDERQFPICPNLQAVNLIDFWDNSDGKELTLFQQSEYSSVKDLTLGNGCEWMAVDLRYMANFRNVHTLTLFSFGQDISNDCEITSPICVTFPHLRLLRLRGWIPSEVLCSINPLNDITVDVGDSDGAGCPLNHTGNLSRTKIVTKMATLHLCCSDHTVDSGFLHIVFELLKNALSLEAMYLSPRMEAALRHDLEEFKDSHGFSFSISSLMSEQA